MAPTQFLRLASPQDMWHKATRELARFEADPSVDHAFNFFVTVYHIRDYAKITGLDVALLDSDPDFQLCRLACNSAKHLELEGKTAASAANRSFGTHGDVAFQGHEEYALLADGTRLPVLQIGRRVLGRVRSWLGITTSESTPAGGAA